MIDFKPACRRVVELLAGVGDERLADPTPCSEFTVADLIDHIDVVAQGSASLARKEPSPDDGAAATGSAGWHERVAEHLRALGAAWDDPEAWRGVHGAGALELPIELWGKIGFTEVVVHGWDLAQATGQSFDLPEPTLRACLEHVTDFDPPLPNLWAPAVAVPADAPLLDQIVARTGRRPN